MSDEDFTPKPFVRSILPYIAVIGILCVVGLELARVIQGHGQVTTAVSVSTSAVGAPESTAADVQWSYCDFSNPAPSVGGEGYVLGCQIWADDALWNWAGGTVMIGASRPLCRALVLTFTPNSWGSNSVVITSDKQVVKTLQIGPPGSQPVITKLALREGVSQFRLEYEKTWSPPPVNGVQDTRKLSNITSVLCGT